MLAKALKFLADYWYLPLFIASAVLGMCFWPGKPSSATTKIDAELAGIKAKREVRDIEIKEGYVAARKHVFLEYTDKRAKLDEKSEKRVKELRDDPAKLAQAIERLSRL